MGMRLGHFGRITAILMAGAGDLTGCSPESGENRAKHAAEEVRASLADVDAPALAQDLSPALVREVQTRLRDQREYLGEVDGEFDSVTLNAVQAFQRSVGLADNGFLDSETLALLRK